MQSFFQQLLNWTTNNHMIVTVTKTKEMIMGHPSKTANLIPLSTDNGYRYVEQVTPFKLLGLYTDNNFSWTSHIDAILSKATQRQRAIPERLRGVFTTRRYTNPRLPYLTFTSCETAETSRCLSFPIASFFSGCNLASLGICILGLAPFNQ